jgi:hypothetical protein
MTAEYGFRDWAVMSGDWFGGVVAAESFAAEKGLGFCAVTAGVVT